MKNIVTQGIHKNNPNIKNKSEFVVTLKTAIEYALHHQHFTRKDLREFLINHTTTNTDIISIIVDDYHHKNESTLWIVVEDFRDDVKTDPNLGEIYTNTDDHLLFLRITTWAYFQYTELIELEESRKSASWAKIFSWISIGLAISSIIVASITQSVRVVNTVPVCTDPSHSVHSLAPEE